MHGYLLGCIEKPISPSIACRCIRHSYVSIKTLYTRPTSHLVQGVCIQSSPLYCCRHLIILRSRQYVHMEKNHRSNFSFNIQRTRRFQQQNQQLPFTKKQQRKSNPLTPTEKGVSGLSQTKLLQIACRLQLRRTGDECERKTRCGGDLTVNSLQYLLLRSNEKKNNGERHGHEYSLKSSKSSVLCSSVYTISCCESRFLLFLLIMIPEKGQTVEKSAQKT